MEDRFRRRTVQGQRPVRHHRPHWRRQDYTAGRHLPGPVPPHAAHEQPVAEQQRADDPAHRRLPRRGRVRGQRQVLPRLLESAPRPRQGRRRAAGTEGGTGLHRARRRRGADSHRQDQRQAAPDRKPHRPRFRAFHQVHAAGPGRLRRFPRSQCQPARRTAGRADRHGNLRPDFPARVRAHPRRENRTGTAARPCRGRRTARCGTARRAGKRSGATGRAGSRLRQASDRTADPAPLARGPGESRAATAAGRTAGTAGAPGSGRRGAGPAPTGRQRAGDAPATAARGVADRAPQRRAGRSRAAGKPRSAARCQRTDHPQPVARQPVQRATGGGPPGRACTPAGATPATGSTTGRAAAAGASWRADRRLGAALRASAQVGCRPCRSAETASAGGRNHRWTDWPANHAGTGRPHCAAATGSRP
ncbi:hypothetical protein D3C76_436910 [compost metagenome]